jgi:hypothetical protein
MTDPLVPPAGSPPPDSPGPAGPPEPAGPDPVWVRPVGLLVACLGALLVAVLCAFLTPFRIGSFLVPISLVLVVAGLTAVTRFAHAVTDHAGLSLIPGGLWLALSLVLSARTTEGDLVLISTNWVATVYLLVGSVTIGVLGYRMITARAARSAGQ